MPNGVLERAAPEDLIDKTWERRDYLGVHPQKQEGLSYVGLHVPVGRLQAADMFELARLADEYGTGELRLTVEQNIVLPNVSNERLDALLAEPLLQQRFSPEPSLLLRGLVACTGNQFCGQAIIETKARALQVTQEVEKRVSVPRPVCMHWTGCPNNSCAQVQVADVAASWWAASPRRDGQRRQDRRGRGHLRGAATCTWRGRLQEVRATARTWWCPSWLGLSW